MNKRKVHYEAAFADYLRRNAIPYVPVDETRKITVAGAQIKSFDLLVYAPGDRRWIVDIKGRQFPYISEDGGKRYWENWVSRQDLEGLKEWEAVFGEGFEACFVFAYLLDGPPDRWPPVPPHTFHHEQYAFLAVPLVDYAQHCRARSASWDTVTIPTTTFRRLVRPIEPVARGTSSP